MGSVLDRLPPESAVAILRLRSLGDCVLTTAALTILQSARPDLRVAVVVEDRFRDIFERLAPTLPPTLTALRSFRPQLCLNLHGGTRSAWLTALSGAPYRAGFSHYRHQAVYNIHIPRAQEILGVHRKVHTAEHLASAVFYLQFGDRRLDSRSLGVSSPVPELPYAVPPCRLSLGVSLPVPELPYAVLHPVAATPAKTWPAAHFLSVANHLAATGLTPIFIGAATDHLAPFSAYRTVAGAPLAQIKSLLSAAALFIGNDSGPAHMAAAFGLPVIVIFGASDPAIWGPWRTHSEVLTAPEGIEQITPTQVLEALSRLVGQVPTCPKPTCPKPIGADHRRQAGARP